jgi:hypothetical protein
MSRVSLCVSVQTVGNKALECDVCRCGCDSKAAAWRGLPFHSLLHLLRVASFSFSCLTAAVGLSVQVGFMYHCTLSRVDVRLQVPAPWRLPTHRLSPRGPEAPGTAAGMEGEVRRCGHAAAAAVLAAADRAGMHVLALWQSTASYASSLWLH